MSRSIHTTRRDLKRLKQADFADGQTKREQVQRLRAALRQKRSIKESVREERQGKLGAPLPTPLDTIPIQVRDEGPYVHYPAGPADLLAVMRQLPPGVLNGLSGIELSLGREEQHGDPDWNDRDPYTDRVGSERLPGIYSGRVLGQYHPQTQLIRLYAYVYPPDLPDRSLWEVYLRLQMLSTLVHEVAHHYDEMARTARGRWRTDQPDTVEIYAERMEHDWNRAIVIPYLEAAYPQETNALCDWIEEHGGIRLPFADLAGDPRTTARGGYLNGSAFSTIGGALWSLAEEVAQGATRKATRLTFANNLHYQESYEDALTIIEGLLTEDPTDTETLLLQADIFVHQTRFAEAAALAQQVLGAAPANCEALEILSDAYMGLEQWEHVIETNTYRLSVSDPQSWYWADALCERGIARAAAGDLAGARADLALLQQCPKRFVTHRIRRLTNALAEY